MATCDYMFDKFAYQRWASMKTDKTATEIEEDNIIFNVLLKRAIKNELSKDDAEIIEMYFFKEYTQRDIAKLFGVNVSTINRRINKSLDTLFEKLKYAAEYRFGVFIAER